MLVRAAAAGSLLVLTSCAVTPATGAREFMLVSENQEVSLGRESDPAVTAQYGLVDDPELQVHFDRVVAIKCCLNGAFGVFDHTYAGVV